MEGCFLTSPSNIWLDFIIFNRGEESICGSYDKLKFLEILFRLGGCSKSLKGILGTNSLYGMLERSGWDDFLIFLLEEPGF